MLDLFLPSDPFGRSAPRNRHKFRCKSRSASSRKKATIMWPRFASFGGVSPMRDSCTALEYHDDYYLLCDCT